MKRKKYKRDIDEFSDKLDLLKSEFGCYIVYDCELNKCVAVDSETAEFLVVGESNKDEN